MCPLIGGASDLLAVQQRVQTIVKILYAAGADQRAALPVEGEQIPPGRIAIEGDGVLLLPVLEIPEPEGQVGRLGRRFA